MNRPSERDVAPWHAIEASADHLDPQLAAAALCVLGLQLEIQVTSSALAALRGQCASDARRALALAMVEDRTRAREIALRFDLLANDHPLFDDAPGAASPDPGAPRWHLSASGEAWLRGLVNHNDVELVLLKVMGTRTGCDFGVNDLDVTVLRRRKSIPITTLSEMFGME